MNTLDLHFTEPVATFTGNSPVEKETDSLSMGFGILLALIGLFLYYLFPYVRQAFTL